VSQCIWYKSTKVLGDPNKTVRNHTPEFRNSNKYRSEKVKTQKFLSLLLVLNTGICLSQNGLKLTASSRI
jgi:hypothetical protein